MAVSLCSKCKAKTLYTKKGNYKCPACGRVDSFDSFNLSRIKKFAAQIAKGFKHEKNENYSVSKKKLTTNKMTFAPPSLSECKESNDKSDILKLLNPDITYNKFSPVQISNNTKAKAKNQLFKKTVNNHTESAANALSLSKNIMTNIFDEGYDFNVTIKQNLENTAYRIESIRKKEESAARKKEQTRIQTEKRREAERVRKEESALKEAETAQKKAAEKRAQQQRNQEQQKLEKSIRTKHDLKPALYIILSLLPAILLSIMLANSDELRVSLFSSFNSWNFIAFKSLANAKFIAAFFLIIINFFIFILKLLAAILIGLLPWLIVMGIYALPIVFCVVIWRKYNFHKPEFKNLAVLLTFIMMIFSVVMLQANLRAPTRDSHSNIITPQQTINELYIFSSLDLLKLNSTISHAYLMNDVNMDGNYFTPVGNISNPFTGTFDGNGYRIENLNINYFEETYVSGNTLYRYSICGMFGVTNNSVIKNLTLLNARISIYSNNSSQFYYHKYHGLLSGMQQGNDIISNCYIKGNITSLNPGNNKNVAGITGGHHAKNSGEYYSIISKVDSDVSIQTNTNQNSDFPSAIAGNVYMIENCKAAGTITANGYSGLAHTAQNITNSFSAMNLNISEDNAVYAFSNLCQNVTNCIDANTVRQSYSVYYQPINCYTYDYILDIIKNGLYHAEGDYTEFINPFNSLLNWPQNIWDYNDISQTKYPSLKLPLLITA